MSATAAQLGDVITAEPVANRSGETRAWVGLVTHVSEWEGKPQYSAVGFSDGQLSHLSNYTDPVSVVHPAASDMARATLAGMYDRPGVSERVRTRLLEIAEIVAFRRIAEVRPDHNGRTTKTQGQSDAYEIIQSIIRHDSGPASTSRRAIWNNTATTKES